MKIFIDENRFFFRILKFYDFLKRMGMSNKEVEQAFVQAKAEISGIARKVHEAARIIAMGGRPMNKDWFNDGPWDNANEATNKWEKCTVYVKAKSARSYSEWVTVTLDDGTILLSTYDYMSGSGNSEFDVTTFRNGAWVERFIRYSQDGVATEREKQKQAELQERLKPFSDIDF